MAQVPLSTRFIGIAQDVAIPENKTNILNNKTEPYTISDLIDTIGTASQGPEGPQGVQGPAGPPGPVGPAGLNWQGSWNKFNSYVEDDAVGYGGASYFCISDIEGGASNVNPATDTTHWALLAAQGAQGIQGVQGPTGPQGAQGPAGPSGSLGYNSYVANILVENTLTVNVLENNLGGAVNLSWQLGNIFITSSGLFTNNNVAIFCNGYYGNDNVIDVKPVINSSSLIVLVGTRFIIGNPTISQPGWDFGGSMTIEIRVYN